MKELTTNGRIEPWCSNCKYGFIEKYNLCQMFLGYVFCTVYMKQMFLWNGCEWHEPKPPTKEG